MGWSSSPTRIRYAPSWAYAVPRGRPGILKMTTRPSGCITSSISTRKPTALNSFAVISTGSMNALVPTIGLGGLSATPSIRWPHLHSRWLRNYLYNFRLSNWVFASLNSRFCVSLREERQRSTCCEGCIQLTIPCLLGEL